MPATPIVSSADPRAAAAYDGGVADVVLYTQHLCGCCSQARRVLRRKGVPFREIGSKEAGGRDGLRARFGPRAGTYPQVVVNGVHVGGASDLEALDASGELDRLLGRAAGARR